MTIVMKLIFILWMLDQGGLVHRLTLGKVGEMDGNVRMSTLQRIIMEGVEKDTGKRTIAIKTEPIYINTDLNLL
jgi:hypothetical protein